jgi:hypothetical protein
MNAQILFHTLKAAPLQGMIMWPIVPGWQIESILVHIPPHDSQICFGSQKTNYVSKEKAKITTKVTEPVYMQGPNPTEQLVSI